MIGSIKGILESKEGNKIIIDVNGVGYEVLMANVNNISKLGNEIKVYTYFHTSENSHTLYGFLTLEEKMFFIMLINIPDIGPKVAINIISSMDIKKLKSAIASGDTAILQTLPRVGNKLANRLVVELKDKLKDESIETYKSFIGDNIERDIIDALVSLGYTITVARNVVEKVRNRFINMKPTINEILKEALKELGR